VAALAGDGVCRRLVGFKIISEKSIAVVAE
jgi:hypothetical protein